MADKRRLGIVVSHPIQYYSPLFKYLAKRLNIVVLYCQNPTDDEIGRDGFGLKFRWDINLLDGYEYVFLQNVSSAPDLSKFGGCNTPGIGEKINEYGLTHVLIMGWYLKSYWQAYFYCIKNNIPVSVRGDSQLNPYENKIKSIFKKVLYPLFIKQYNTLFYVGQRNKEYLLKHGASEKQLMFAPHAVDQDFWLASDRNTLITPAKTIFLWVGKFIPKKRPLNALKAFCEAYKQNKNIELWMIGAGELLQESINSAQGNESIKFLGFKNQRELHKLYSIGHCLILTSDYAETWGLVVNEAFSMGLPVIVSRACGCSPDLVEDGKTGFIYELGKIDQLAEKIISMHIAIRQEKKNFKDPIRKKNMVYSYESNFIALNNFMHN